MNCIFKTRGKAPHVGCEITLTGTLTSSYATVTIDGIKYTTAQTLIVPAGTVISLYVGGMTTSSRKNCKITVDDNIVLSGSAGTYNLIAEKDLIIKVQYPINISVLAGAITVTSV